MAIFVDADTMLAGNFISWVTGAITSGIYGKMPNALELYQSMDEGTKAGLRQQATCTAKAANCVEYAACSR